MTADPQAFDVVVIGAGVSGLLAAARLAQAGRRVLLAEKLSFLGGRFSAFSYQGAEVSSGAFHTLPHGSQGPLARSLKSLGVDLAILPSPVFAGFYFDGRQRTARTPFDVLKMVPRPADRRMIWRSFFHLWLRPRFPGSIRDWLDYLGASPEVQRIYDRFCQFALSVPIDRLPYAEGRAVADALIRYGLPGVPAGGARAVVRALGQAAAQAGVTVWKTAQVERLLLDGGQICGAVIHQRRSGERVTVRARQVISTIGLAPTVDLLAASGADLSVAGPLLATPPAAGLKVHVLSPVSLVDHPAILFCLDTHRIAGMIQITNSDPSLAPPGMHLLISHQVLPAGADWQAELAQALEDWRALFGADFARCQVLGTSVFPARYPVNWAAQGADVRGQPFAGLGIWLAGDGMKPPGLMMAEGAAASAEQAAGQALGLPDFRPWVPSRLEQAATWAGRIGRYLKHPRA